MIIFTPIFKILQTINNVVQPKTFRQFLKMANISLQQYNTASHGQILNRCLILKENQSDVSYKYVDDFIYVLAPFLEAVNVPDQFENIVVEEVFMPLVREVSYGGFFEAQLGNLPLTSLQQVGSGSFSFNYFTVVNLSQLTTINYKNSFSNCPNLRLFIASKLQNINQYCFSDCPTLKTILTLNATIADFAFENCSEIRTILASQGDFGCDCANCPRCKGNLQQCLENGQQFAQSEEYRILQGQELVDQKFVIYQPFMIEIDVLATNFARNTLVFCKLHNGQNKYIKSIQQMAKLVFQLKSQVVIDQTE
uniref:Leucine rich repeats-containing protein n=1 Tax=Trepomonas sp. PC1 TaxID=1076344 RepID=A0A146K076_9EUKA|eukprot:JAP89009.1 Hypothetical protein TPC1_31496 [Trepomonas sp. PC1]